MDTENKGKSLCEVYSNLGLGDMRLVPSTYVKEVDEVLLARLMQIGCTQEEVAYVMGCSSLALGSAIKRISGFTFGELAEHHRQGVKVALRRKQIELALEGNVKMLLHLGQHVLGQVDGKEEIANMGNKADKLPDSTLIQIVNGQGGSTNINGGRITHDATREENIVGANGIDRESDEPVGCGVLEG